MSDVTFKIDSEIHKIVKDYETSAPMKVKAVFNKRTENAYFFRVSWVTHNPGTDDEHTGIEVKGYLRSGWKILDLDSQEMVLSAIGIEWEE